MKRTYDNAKAHFKLLYKIVSQICDESYEDLMLDLSDELEVFAEFVAQRDPEMEQHVVTLWTEFRDSKYTPRTPSQKLKVRVYESCGYACTRCGSKDNLHIDHVVPYSKGGKTIFENLTVLCGRCNLSKKDSLN